MPAALRIAHRLPRTEAEGPGRRFALWVQGCSLACPGCCNPELFPRTGGSSVAVPTLVEEVLAARRDHALDGITVIGGEPLEQAPAIVELARALQGRGLGVIVFTGFTWPEVQGRIGGDRLVGAIDTLVCGRFDRGRREPAIGGRRFIGSRNQTLHHLSPRYAEPALWRGPPALELRITPEGAIEVSGDPGLGARMARRVRGNSR
ncbi:MAG: radical SAM protein [Myxococcales bacterium]|nr:radical SAM protein [Myxococcales bacterium]MCB9567962.1 radical SAM protein [Myxococcales bacterium]MCB9700407.1 radical SAM protein [Myxococcales bacterium]